MLFALVRSSGLSRMGAVFVPSTLAPPGVAQIRSASCGNLILKEPAPHTSSNRGLYTACESRNATQAVSGKPISRVSTGGLCACSASGILSLYPVARESKKFPPKNRPCSWLYWSTGKNGEYGCRCAARPKVNRSGKCDHCQVDRGDRSTKACVWHVARRASLISVRRNVLVEKHKLAECFYCLSSGILKHRRLICQNR